MNDSQYREQAFHTILAKSIIANQYAVNLNESLKGTKFYKGNIKVYGRPYITALIIAEKKEFAKVDETDTRAVDNVFEQTDMILETLSKCPFIDYGELNQVIKALAKDKDKINELINKILENE